MPELPDLTILADAFSAALVGRPIDATSAADPLVAPGDAGRARRPRSATACCGVRRRGKFLILETDRTGDLGITDADRPIRDGGPGRGRGRRASVVAALRPPGAGPPGRRRAPGPAAPAGCRRGRPASSCATSTRPGWASSTSSRRTRPRERAGHGPGRARPGRRRPGPDPGGLPGPDPASPRRAQGPARNQAFVAGIGNAYSDEILWAARLSPFRRRSTLAAEEVDALYVAMRETLAAVDRGPARARPADLRDPGPGSPEGPPPWRPAVPPLRSADQPGRRARSDLVLSGVPALTAASACERGLRAA